MRTVTAGGLWDVSNPMSRKDSAAASLLRKNPKKEIISQIKSRMNNSFTAQT
jgi:hypothetical protein